MNEAEQHQDELLKQERLLEILNNFYCSKYIGWQHLSVATRKSDALFLASALGLNSEFKKHVLGE